jgi:hypothetical protein
MGYYGVTEYWSDESPTSFLPRERGRMKEGAADL